MQPEPLIQQYDILIVGAGPAGCACALALKDAGLKVAMVEKATFPRDKVCGDAIPGRAIKVLRSINPEFEISFRNLAKKYDTKKTSLFYKGNTLTFDWAGDAYTCARMEFDNFLFTLVQQHTSTAIFTETLPHSIIKNEKGFSVTIKNSATVFNTQLLIGADGAHSIVAKQLAGSILHRQHHVGSVRAYFSNVSDTESYTTEIYFDKKMLPGYLWVFPLPGNIANVGFGMLSSEIAKRKINIKKAFYEFIEHIPELKLKFKDAVQQGDLEGFGLPLGSRIGTLSGERFMLTGDAASLIDPISGDGIGNAMLSGQLAAQQAIACFKENNFSATQMNAYDAALLQKIGKELKKRYNMQRALSKVPSLLDVIFPACSNKYIKSLVQNGL